MVDGFTIRDYIISDRASFYEDKKRLSHVERNGAQHLIGSIEKLKKISGADEEKIIPMDLSDVTVSKSFILEELFASEEMLLTVAKTAYEWYCYNKEVNEYDPEVFQSIVDIILKKRSVDDSVQIIIPGRCPDAILISMCELGTHGLFSYTDEDGWEYVIFCFWGIITYKVRIRRTVKELRDPETVYNVYLYQIDGEKRQSAFATYGSIPHFVAMQANDVITDNRSIYISRLENLLKTKVLTLRKLKSLVDDLRKALLDYKRTNKFERLVAYETPERVFTFLILSQLQQHEQDYDYKKGFNENIRSIFGCSEVLSVDINECKAYVKTLQDLHIRGTLLDRIETDIAVFDEVYSRIRIQ